MWKHVVSTIGLLQWWQECSKYEAEIEDLFKLGLESYTASLLPQSTGKSKSEGQLRFKGKRYRLHLSTGVWQESGAQPRFV